MLFAIHRNLQTCQASLSVNICMRLNPDKDRLIADSIEWSEQLRSKSMAGCDDTMTMVSKVYRMPAFETSLMNQVGAKEAVALCEKMGLRWQGKLIAPQTWGAIQGIVAYCQDVGVLSAIGDIKTICPDFDKLTLMARVCKTATTFIKTPFSIDEFQQKGPNPFALEASLHWIHNGLRFGDIDKSELSGQFLVGNLASEVGIVQGMIRKLQIADYLWKHYRSSPSFDKEVGALLWERLSDVQTLAEWATAAEFWKRTANTPLTKGQTGIVHWTEAQFQEFCQQLTNQTAVAFAELIYGLLTTEFDENALNHCGDHPEGGHADHDSLGNLLRGADDDLAMAYKRYTKSLAAQARPIMEVNMETQPLADSMMGDDDLVEGDDGTEAAHQLKKQIHDKVMADVKSKMRFHCLPHLDGPMGNFLIPAELTKVMDNCPFHAVTTIGYQVIIMRTFPTFCFAVIQQ